MNKVAVVIPSYKKELDNNEKISLEQCNAVLGKYDRFLILPDGIDENYGDKESKIYINPVWLSSRKKYSEYILSYEFYNQFSNYEYVLIYQLDSFVFEDELEYFCSLGYGFIGAEWLYGLECHVEQGNRWFIGNGGLSLRNVSKFKKWIRTEKELVEYGKLFLPEDLVIAIYGKEYLNIAPREIAMQFSFDMHPQKCFEIQGKRLPFGCHAWHRFDPVFWKEIIDAYGYNVSIVDVDSETDILYTGEKRFKQLENCFDISKIDKCLKQIMSSYKGELYVFGAGQYGLSFVNMVKSTDIIIKNVLDNDGEKVGRRLEGIKIRHIKEALSEKKLPILVSLAIPEVIEKQFAEYGLKKGIDYAYSRELQKKMIECNDSINR